VDERPRHDPTSVNVPVNLYRSVTAYDRTTQTLIRDVPWASRSSNTLGRITTDSGTDLYFGPKPPPGHDTNWIPTRPDMHFELIFRFHGPEKPLFEKAWQLPDLQRSD
jgi:hypothetical protein